MGGCGVGKGTPFGEVLNGWRGIIRGGGEEKRIVSESSTILGVVVGGSWFEVVLKGCCLGINEKLSLKGAEVVELVLDASVAAVGVTGNSEPTGI